MVTVFATRVPISGAGTWCPYRGMTVEYAEQRIPSDPSNAYYTKFDDIDDVSDWLAADRELDWMPWESYEEHRTTLARRG